MRQKANVAVDNLVHRPFCKCARIPIDGFLEGEMLGQSADVSLKTTSFLKLLPLTFPPISFWLLLLGFFPYFLRSVRNTGYSG